MTHRTFAMAAGTIFTLVALFHLVRIFEDWPVMIGDWSVPKWVSWVALIIAGALALLGFRLAANESD
jgi:Mn2+/Fe2+ NRAMP family transporter